MGKNKNCLLMFRLPATDEGFDLVKQMRKALNKDSYKMRTLYTGKRPHGHTPYTLKKDAESIRVYIDSKMPVPKPSDEEAMSLYMEGFNKGKAKIDALYKEVEEQAKRIDDSPSYNRLKVERDELTKEVDSLKIKLAKRESNYNAIYNTKVKEWNKTLSAKDTVISNYQNDMDLRQREIDRLNTIVDEERSNAESKPVSRNGNDVDLDRFVDNAFDKWVAQQPWHKRLIYKIGSISWKDFAMTMFVFWTIPMIILLTLKVEGVIN